MHSSLLFSFKFGLLFVGKRVFEWRVTTLKMKKFKRSGEIGLLESNTGRDIYYFAVADNWNVC